MLVRFLRGIFRTREQAGARSAAAAPGNALQEVLASGIARHLREDLDDNFDVERWAGLGER